MHSRILSLLRGTIFFALLLFSVPFSATIFASSSLKIVVTTSILKDTLQNIVGPEVAIISLMGHGVDPHTYKATLKNMQDLYSADLVFYHGLHLEGKMADMLTKFSREKPVYAVSNAIDTSQYISDPKSKEAVDPHIWFDIQLWKQVVSYMSTQMQIANPAAASAYQTNTEAYLEMLENLHQEITACIQTIPPNQRILITAHDAFSYFGRAYHIQVKSLQGISTVEECGLRDITDLVDYIVQHKIKAIFPENSIPIQALRAVVEGCKHKGHTVELGTELYSDALGKIGTIEGTYAGMIRSNVTTVVNALR
jgi:manganese/zinc/iron transport system substrate-binding protein